MSAAFSASQLQPWLAALRTGHIAAAPAEGVYGYVADPFNPAALELLLAAKQRSAEKGFILLIQSVSQLEQLCPTLTERDLAAIDVCWQPFQPPITLILPALATLPPLLTGNRPTIAVRLAKAPYMQQYLQAAATPLVSTSLNISGEPAAISASQIPAGIPALTLPHKLSGVPSRIFNPHTNQWLR